MIDEDAGWTDDAIRAVAFGQQNTLDCRDPRTVEGADVSFETEKHMNFAPEAVVLCAYCLKEQCICPIDAEAVHA